MEAREATLREKVSYMAKKNGIVKILDKLAEECSEYAAARLKIKNDGLDPRRALNQDEELADVINLTWQIYDALNEDGKARIRHLVEEKLDRAAAEQGV